MHVGDPYIPHFEIRRIFDLLVYIYSDHMLHVMYTAVMSTYVDIYSYYT